jgi:hypothetical protein
MGNRHETTATAPKMRDQEEPQRLQITLDPEITETIRRMAREQRTLRTEIEGSRRDTFELGILMKTHGSQLDQLFGTH